MNLYNVFPEVEAMVFSSDVTAHVAPNQIRMKQGEKNKQTPNGKQGSPPLLLEIAATVPPISSSLYVQFKGSTHQIHIAPGRGGAWV